MKRFLKRWVKKPGFPVFVRERPQGYLEKHHGRLIQDEVIKGLIPEAYRSSIEKEKIDVVEMPEISQVKLESNILFFRAVVEVKPQIEIKDYKILSLNIKRWLSDRRRYR